MRGVGLTDVEQCPYSPDLNMYDQFLFTRLQENCRMQHYGSTEELKMDAVFEVTSKLLFLRAL